jgi:hypothetical protein
MEEKEFFDKWMEYISLSATTFANLPLFGTNRLNFDFGIKDEDIESYINDLPLALWFEEVAKILGNTEKIKVASNYITTDFLGLKKANSEVKLPSATNFAELANMLSENTISSRGAKDILAMIVLNDESPMKIATEKNLLQKNDEGELKGIVEKIISENPEVVATYKGGKENAIMSLVGKIIKETNDGSTLKIKKHYIDFTDQRYFVGLSGVGGIKYVIVGHSERRAMGETNEIINKKLIAVLKAKLTPILCVGESVRSHDGFYLAKVREQLSMCLSGIPKNQIKQIVIAYEPVWALSSTENRHDATPHDFEEMKIYIKKILTDMFGQTITSSVRIIYGGSANKEKALISFIDEIKKGSPIARVDRVIAIPEVAKQ